jgi:hypothetical protein
MAFFHETRRNVDQTIRSSDNALNVLVIVLLVAFAFASWYFYGRVGALGVVPSSAVETQHPVTAQPHNPSP